MMFPTQIYPDNISVRSSLDWYLNMHSSLAFLVRKINSSLHEVSDSQNVNSSNEQDSKDSEAVKLHFNLWDVYTKKNKKATFLDVGLHIDNVNDVEEIMMFFPFNIDDSDVIDLHGCLSNDSELVRTIFNQNLSFDSVSHSLSFVRFDGNLNSPFFIHAVPFSNPKMVLLEKKNYQYNGGYLTSTLIIFQKDYLECIGKAQSEQSSSGRISNSGYFRFRIPLKKREIFISDYKPKHALLTGSLNKSEIVDFRVNEARSLPPELYHEKDVRKMEFCVSKIDYFLVKDAWCEFQTSHGSFKKARTLEKSFWSKYLLYKNSFNSLDKILENKDSMVIYHWVKNVDKDEPFVSFSAFSKFIEQRSDWTTILAYVFVIVIISIVSNIISG